MKKYIEILEEIKEQKKVGAEIISANQASVKGSKKIETQDDSYNKEKSYLKITNISKSKSSEKQVKNIESSLDYNKKSEKVGISSLSSIISSIASQKAIEAEKYKKSYNSLKYAPKGSFKEIQESTSSNVDNLLESIQEKSFLGTIDAVASQINLGASGAAENLYSKDDKNKLRYDLKLTKVPNTEKEDNAISFENIKNNKESNEIVLSNPVNKKREDVKAPFNFKYDEEEHEGIPDYPLAYHKDKEFEKVGNIYVIPPFNTNEDPTKIPLQNNIEYEKLSKSASYNSLKFFNRNGEIKQYTGTDSLDAISIKTSYQIGAGNKTASSLKELQEIELKYRSLILPSTTSENYNGDKKNGSFDYYTRPPLINIVIGRKRDDDWSFEDDDKNLNDNGIFNLFTEINTNEEIYYRNFAVTNVSIDKPEEKYPYYVVKDDDGYFFKDHIGFDVTLNIVEIDDDYLGSLPNFDTYSNFIGNKK